MLAFSKLRIPNLVLVRSKAVLTGVSTLTIARFLSDSLGSGGSKCTLAYSR